MSVSATPGRPASSCAVGYNLAFYNSKIDVAKINFIACELPEDTEIQWLASGSDQQTVLSNMMSNKTALAGAEKLTGLCHTGCLEVYYSNQLV